MIFAFLALTPGGHAGDIVSPLEADDWHGRMILDMCGDGTPEHPGRCPECCVTECTEAVELDAGEPVPCVAGILVPDTMVEDLLLCREIEFPRCSAMLERETGVSASKLTACSSELNACNEALSKTDKLLEKSLENRKQLEWYQDPWMHITIGVVVGVAVTSAAHKW
tara:strand:- start:565 stop:1065 length:501 start_codon:yes stop_codon:yes gene_type:complete